MIKESHSSSSSKTPIAAPTRPVLSSCSPSSFLRAGLKGNNTPKACLHSATIVNPGQPVHKVTHGQNGSCLRLLTTLVQMTISWQQLQPRSLTCCVITIHGLHVQKGLKSTFTIPCRCFVSLHCTPEAGHGGRQGLTRPFSHLLQVHEGALQRPCACAFMPRL